MNENKTQALAEAKIIKSNTSKLVLIPKFWFKYTGCNPDGKVKIFAQGDDSLILKFDKQKVDKVETDNNE